MRLCLDEHYAPRIAAALRDRGHDVIAVQADDALRGLSDEELLTFCARERRALVSENVADFMPLVQRRIGAGESHPGLVFSSPASMPRRAETIGLFVDALDVVLRDHRDEHALCDRVVWLRPPAAA